MQPEPFAELVRDDSLDICLPMFWGALMASGVNLPWSTLKVKGPHRLMWPFLCVMTCVYVKACAGLIVTNIRAGEVINNRHVVGSILVYYAYACFCYGSAIHHNSMLLVILPFGYSVVAGHSVCGVL